MGTGETGATFFGVWLKNVTVRFGIGPDRGGTLVGGCDAGGCESEPLGRTRVEFGGKFGGKGNLIELFVTKGACSL